MDETPFVRLWPFLRPPKDQHRGRLVPATNLTAGDREAVLARMKARKEKKRK